MNKIDEVVDKLINEDEQEGRVKGDGPGVPGFQLYTVNPDDSNDRWPTNYGSMVYHTGIATEQGSFMEPDDIYDTNRLKVLALHGIAERERQGRKFMWKLTPKGMAIYKKLKKLMNWEEE